jgi:hypothetical protein
VEHALLRLDSGPTASTWMQEGCDLSSGGTAVFDACREGAGAHHLYWFARLNRSVQDLPGSDAPQWTRDLRAKLTGTMARYRAEFVR